MARTRQFKQTRPHNSERRSPLEAIAVLMLADAEDDTEELVAIMFLKLAIEDKRRQLRKGGRYGPHGRYDRKKSKDFFDLLLYEYPDRWFKGWLRYAIRDNSSTSYYTKPLARLDRKSFWHVHGLIWEDTRFFSKGRRPQRAVKYQLATFLCRSGAETALKTAGVMSIAEGTVYEYMRRVTNSL